MRQTRVSCLNEGRDAVQIGEISETFIVPDAYLTVAWFTTSLKPDTERTAHDADPDSLASRRRSCALQICQLGVQQTADSSSAVLRLIAQKHIQNWKTRRDFTWLMYTVCSFLA